MSTRLGAMVAVRAAAAGKRARDAAANPMEEAPVPKGPESAGLRVEVPVPKGEFPSRLRRRVAFQRLPDPLRLPLPRDHPPLRGLPRHRRRHRKMVEAGDNFLRT